MRDIVWTDARLPVTMLGALLAAGLFALSAVSAYRATRIVGGTLANFSRLCLAALMLGCWAHTMGSGIQGAAFPFFLLSGAMGFGLGDLALFQALPRLGSRRSMVLVHCLAAPLGAAIEWLWLETALSGVQVLCGSVILAGVAVALAPGRDRAPPSRHVVSGVIFGFWAAFGQGFGAVLSRKANQVAALAGESIDGVTAAYQRILAGVVISAVVLLVLQQRRPTDFAAPLGGSPGGRRTAIAWRQGLPWIAFNALAGPTLGVSAFQWALQSTPAGIVLPIVATTPLLVIPLARFVEGERPTRRSLIGSLIAVLGAAALTALRQAK